MAPTNEAILVSEAGFPWSIGGVSTWLRDLTSSMPDWRFTVICLVPSEQQKLPLPFGPANTRFIVVPIDEALGMDAVVDRVIARTADVRPALVHASSSGLAGFVALALSKESGAPLVLTEHGIAWSERRRRGTYLSHTHWGSADSLGLARNLYAAADRITSVSHANTVLQRRLMDGAVQVDVIPNGVSLDESAAGLVTSDSPTTVVFAGRVSPEKGVDRFVRIAALLARERPELSFEVRGPEHDPVYAAYCHALSASLGMAERLQFVGAVPRHALFDGAGLLLVPSRLEACPYVVLEAMAAGVPVVTSNAGDCARIVRGAGLAVNGGAERFARAALELLEPSAAVAAAAAGTRAVQEQYSATAMTAAYRELYRSVAGQARRRAA